MPRKDYEPESKRTEPHAWKEGKYDAAERRLMWAALAMDDKPRGGSIVVDEESELWWERQCECATGNRRARQKAYERAYSRRQRPEDAE